MSNNRIFSQIEPSATREKKNIFDLSHAKKMSLKMGGLYPCFLMDVIPSDKITITPAAMARLAPMIAPIMHKVNVYMHFFFVPNRILYEDTLGWEKFITGGAQGTDDPVYPSVLFDNGQQGKGTLADYLGLPVTDTSAVINVSAFPFAAYQAIYNEYYRDQNLIDEVNYKLVDGSNSTNTELFQLRQRAFHHDYFTSCLPFAQRGPEALLPLGDEAPILWRDPLDPEQPNPSNSQLVWNNDGTQAPAAETFETGTGGVFQQVGTGNPAILDLNDTHYTDLSNATQASIRDLRTAFKLQEYLEKMARGGARYTEFLQTMFGVKAQDQRLQRPEYLGGCANDISISEVLQTSASSSDVFQSDTPQGNMAGHAVSFGKCKPISMYAQEHGYIMGIMSIMPMTGYQQGVHRSWRRTDRYDYYLPQFAHIGEQSVLRSEIFATNDINVNNETFGYVPRYSEYKYIPDGVAGDFRDTLDFWHLSRKFASAPSLNQDFIECKPDDVKRIFAAQDDTDNVWCQCYFNVKAARPMPFFGAPKFG